MISNSSRTSAGRVLRKLFVFWDHSRTSFRQPRSDQCGVRHREWEAEHRDLSADLILGLALVRARDGRRRNFYTVVPRHHAHAPAARYTPNGAPAKLVEPGSGPRAVSTNELRRKVIREVNPGCGRDRKI